MRRNTVLALTLILAGSLIGCGKNQEEADKFRAGTSTLQIAPGPLKYLRLENGVSVYLQEEHSRPMIAVEVLYKAGAANEGAGKTQVSCLLAHMVIFSGSESFKAGEAVEAISKEGRINGELTNLFTHFDYVVPSGQLDLALKVEAERLTSSRFTDDLMKKYAEKCAGDVTVVLEDQGGTLSKFGVMALNQAYNHHRTSVSIMAAPSQLTADDLKGFLDDYYRPENIVVVAIGDLDTTDAVKLIQQRFGSLPVRAAPAAPPKPVTRSVNATWDVPADVAFLVFPGPYENERERLALTMLGTYLSQYLMRDADLYTGVKSSLASSYICPVEDELPFFVFLQAKKGFNLQDIQTTALITMEKGMSAVSEDFFETIKSSLVSFVETSSLRAQVNVDFVPHYQFIGQEALNVGMKHYLRGGVETGAFVELVRSISYEEAKRYFAARVNTKNLLEVTFTGPKAQSR